MVGCMDIGLAILQDMLGPRRIVRMCGYLVGILVDRWHIRRYRIAIFFRGGVREIGNDRGNGQTQDLQDISNVMIGNSQ